MQVFVKVRGFDTFSSEENEHLKKIFASQLQYVLNSGKVVQSGIFADSIGGFFILEIESTNELPDLISSSMLHNMHVEIHPVMAIEKFSEVFQENVLSYKN